MWRHWCSYFWISGSKGLPALDIEADFLLAELSKCSQLGYKLVTGHYMFLLPCKLGEWSGIHIYKFESVSCLYVKHMWKETSQLEFWLLLIIRSMFVKLPFMGASSVTKENISIFIEQGTFYLHWENFSPYMQGKKHRNWKEGREILKGRCCSHKKGLIQGKTISNLKPTQDATFTEKKSRKSFKGCSYICSSNRKRPILCIFVSAYLFFWTSCNKMIRRTRLFVIIRH